MNPQFPTDSLSNLIIENSKSKLKVRDSLTHGQYVFFTSGTKPRAFDKFLCEGENIFLATGGIAHISYHNKPAAYSTDCYSITTKNGLQTKFLYYFLLSQIDCINKSMFKGAALKHLQKKMFKEICIPVPREDIQLSIITILDEVLFSIEIAISNTETNLSNTRELFESYLNNILSKKHGDWVEKNLKDFTESISTGPFGSLLHKSDYTSHGDPIVNPINLIDGKIVPNPLKLIDKPTKERLGSYILNEGDIVVARRGEIGRCAVVDSTQTGWICGTGSFFIRPLASVNSDFLAHLLRSTRYKNKLLNVATGATMKNISNKALSNLMICIPQLNTQVKILRNISDLEYRTKELENIYQQKLNALNELKQSILQKAFTGELTKASNKQQVMA